MKCPTCGENTPDAWRRLIVDPHYAQESSHRYELPDPHPEIRPEAKVGHQVQFDWMVCASKDCGQIVIHADTTPTRSMTRKGFRVRRRIRGLSTQGTVPGPSIRWCRRKWPATSEKLRRSST